MGTLTLAWRIATGPVWILWTGYKGLWWTFGDTHEPSPRPVPAKIANDSAVPPPGSAAARSDRPSPEQARSFEVTDSGPRPIPAPTRLLAGGFAGTVLSSLGMLLASNAAAAAGAVPPDRAMLAWGWSTVLMAITSIFMVRSVARRQRRKHGIGAAFRAVREAGCSAARGVAHRASRACRWAGARCSSRGERAEVPVESPRSFLRSRPEAIKGAFRRLWASIGRPRPASGPAA